MEQNDLYPEGWTYRKFFAPRSANKGTGGPNKKVRQDDNLVDEILRDNQKVDEQLPQAADSGSSQNGAQLNGGG